MQSQLRCFQRLALQHASERFVKIKRCGCWDTTDVFFLLSRPAQHWVPLLCSKRCVFVSVNVISQQEPRHVSLEVVCTGKSSKRSKLGLALTDSTLNSIYIYIHRLYFFSEFQIPVEIGLTDGIASPAAQSSQLQVPVGN